MFGLDLQQLLETAAEKQLESGHLENAVSLYKLARVSLIVNFNIFIVAHDSGQTEVFNMSIARICEGEVST